MDLNSVSNRAILTTIFPGLANDPQFKICSPQTPVYNCIAWAMGFKNRWVSNTSSIIVNFYHNRYVWWPEGVEDSQRCEALIEAFRALGFEPTENHNYNPLYDKAILYTDGKIWTHASRIIEEGIEHSKFGEEWDAIHGNDRFQGSSYGYPYVIMQRLHSLKKEYLSKHPLKIADHQINEEKAAVFMQILKAVMLSSK